MTVVRIYTCLSRAVGRSSSSWTLLVVAIDRVSTMQLFVKEALAMTYNTTYVFHKQRQLMMLENQQWATRSTRARNDTCITQKEKT